MTEPRFCICVSIPPGTSPERLKGAMSGLLDYYFGFEKGGNPVPLAVPVVLKSLDILLESGLVEEASKLVRTLLKERGS